MWKSTRVGFKSYNGGPTFLTICPFEVIVHKKKKTSSLWRFRSKYKQKLNGRVVYITYKLGMKRNLRDLGLKTDLIRYDNLKTFGFNLGQEISKNQSLALTF